MLYENIKSDHLLQQDKECSMLLHTYVIKEKLVFLLLRGKLLRLRNESSSSSSTQIESSGR